MTRRTAPETNKIPFEDVTSKCGVEFKHESGGSGKKWMPETMGSGVAIFDYDGDGKPDLYFVNGRPWDRGKPDTPGRLYRNLGVTNGSLKFEDVTRKAGLDFSMYAMGVAAADIDNDGDQDLIVTGLDEVRLFVNQGNGRFVDASKGSGLPGKGWWTAAMLLDYDKDGSLDLFLGRYVDWSAETDIQCFLNGTNKSYCTPERYPPAQSRLFRGDGHGRFSDVTESTGLGGEKLDKTLGAAAFDVNNDGWIDFAVANDTQPNRLWKNLGKGADGKIHFEDVGMTSGMGVDESGKARGAMGISWASLKDDGSWSVAIGNFSNEMMSLYTTKDGEFFADDAISSGLGPATLLPLKFGVSWNDFDGDGQLDLVVANGHVEPTISSVQSSVTYEQPAMLFRGAGNGKLSQIPAESLGDLARPVVGRGLALGDLDGDGSVDIVMTANGGAPRVLLNRSGSGSKNVRVRLAGSKLNRDAIGALVTATIAGKAQRRLVSGGDSYLSSSDRQLFFGLGSQKKTEKLEVRWPDGTTDSYENLEAGRSYRLNPGGKADAL